MFKITGGGGYDGRREREKKKTIKKVINNSKSKSLGFFIRGQITTLGTPRPSADSFKFNVLEH